MAKQGLTSPSSSSTTPITNQNNAIQAAMGGAVVNGMVNGRAANPKDLPGYTPGSLPGDRVATTPTTEPGGMTPRMKASMEKQGLLTPQTEVSGAVPTIPTPTQPKPTDQAPQALTDQVAALQQGVDKYKQQATQGLGAITAAKIPPPPDAGAGSAGVNKATSLLGGTQTEPDSVIAKATVIDPNVDTPFVTFDEQMSPYKQKTSLLDEYNKMSSKLGIEGMNEELLDAKKIIDGTEDDIRNEITAAGGMATDSQVLALSNARNKSLIKNYNYLLDARNSTMQQLSTIMDLTSKDRQMAMQEFDSKMNYGFKVMEFKQRAVENARDMYSKMTAEQLMALTGGDPRNLSMIDKTMGWQDGSTARLAAIPKEKDLQFISGTENQASGYFDKTTGKFTSLGGGGMGTKAKAELAAAEKAETQVTRTVSRLDNIISSPALASTFGLKNYLNRSLPGTASYVLASEVNTLIADLALAARGELKGQGSVSDFEGRSLKEAQTALKMNMSPEQAKKELAKVRGAIRTSSGMNAKIKITDPNTGQTSILDSNQSQINDAIRDGMQVEYQ